MSEVLPEGSSEVLPEVSSAEAQAKPPLSPRILPPQSITSLHQGVIASGYSHLYPHPLCEPGSQPDDSLHPITTEIIPSPAPEAVDWPAGTVFDLPTSTTASQATVVTFSPHPREYFSGVFRPLLTPVAEKIWQLTQLGIEQLVMLPFNQALAELSPEAFVKDILIEGLQAQHISVGNDFHFGKGRAGNAAVLADIAARYGVPVTRVALKYEKGDRISSSRIRQALQTGELTEATQLLGRPYTLTGRVVEGQKLGRTIGFPTANLQLPENKFLPRTGVYSVRVYGITPHPLPGVMNLGQRPTVNGQTLTTEVHLLNWSGDLYGRLVTVSLESFIRPEQKFDSLAQLKAQIAQDCDVAIATLNPGPSQPSAENT